MPNTLQKSSDDAINGHCGHWTCGITKNTSGKYVQSTEVLYLLVQSLKASGTMYSSLKLLRYKHTIFVRNRRYSREIFREREQGLDEESSG
jgi:hypothetical protein